MKEKYMAEVLVEIENSSQLEKALEVAKSLGGVYTDDLRVSVTNHATSYAVWHNVIEVNLDVEAKNRNKAKDLAEQFHITLVMVLKISGLDVRGLTYSVTEIWPYESWYEN